MAIASLLLAGCGGNGGAGVGGECETSENCQGGLVCDPDTLTCAEAGGSCETHGECGAGGYCADDGSCAANTPGGPCDTSDDCVGGQVCQPSSGTCIEASTGGADGGDECGGELFESESTPPNVLIMVDRTGSMNNPPDGSSRDKWEIAQDVVSDLVSDFGEEMYFGLMLFPGTNRSGNEGESCGRGEVFVDPGAGTAADISEFINNAGTTGFGTPIEPAFSYLHPDVGFDGEFWEDDKLSDPDRENFILLISDGDDSCESQGSDPVRGVEQHRDRSPDVRTIVVGFGGGVDPDELTAMSEAGGMERDGDPNYWQADSEGELEEALAEIAGSLISCTLTLDEVPPNIDELHVFVDGEELARDESRENGWDYDEDRNQVIFFGAACDSLRGGADNVQIIFGCPDDIIID